MSDLLSRAKEIKNATEIGENTAERVGGVMVDTVNEITSLQERAVNHEDTLTTHGKQITALQNKGQNMEYDIEQQQGVLNSQGTRLTEVEHRADEHDTQIAKVQDEKAPKVGYAPDLKVNFAKELVGRGEATPQVIGKIRPTGEISIGDGNATIEKIKGNSVVLNQLFVPLKNLNYEKNNVHIVSNIDNSFTIWTDEGGATEVVQKSLSVTQNLSYVGHKLLITGCNNAFSGFGIWDSFSNSMGTVFKNNSVVTASKNGNVVFAVQILAGIFVPPTIWRPKITDLTLMFGAGDEPTTFEEFEARRPLGVTDDYNEGEIISYDGANELQSVGFNAYNGAYAKVIGGQKYHALGNITSIGFATEMNGETTAITLDSEGMFTPTEDGYVHAEGSDICIHLAHTYTPEHTTEYEENTLQLPDVKAIKDKDGNPLFPYGLLSAGSAHDEITATKAIKRIGKRAFIDGDKENASVLTDGTSTLYALAEPIEVDLEEPLNLTYEAWDFGTEELHTDEKTTPLNADISYQFNAVDRIRENTTKASDLEARVAQLEAMLTQMAQASESNEMNV